MEYIKFYTDYKKVFDCLNSFQTKKLLNAIFNYAATGTAPELKGKTKDAFNCIKQIIDSDNKKREKLAKKRQFAGSKGAKNRWNGNCHTDKKAKNGNCHKENSNC